MKWEWLANDNTGKAVTFYNSNLTLNKAACNHFEDVGYVLIGIDKENKRIGIKPAKKDDINNEIYSEDMLYKISIGKSYGRISNKSIIEMIANEFCLDFSNNQNYKKTAEYDVVHHILIVQM